MRLDFNEGVGKKLAIGMCGIVILGVGGFFLFNHIQKQRVEQLPYTDLVTKSEQTEFLSQCELLVNDYFKGKIGVEERNQRLEKILVSFNRKGNPQKEKHLKAILQHYSPLLVSIHVLPIILKKAYGYPVSKEQKQKLENLDRGGMDVETYLSEQVEAITPYVQKFKEYGIIFRPETGWDLGTNLTPRKIKEDARLYTAILMLISPEAAWTLADENRKVPIQIDEYVYLPPTRDLGQERTK